MDENPYKSAETKQGPPQRTKTNYPLDKTAIWFVVVLIAGLLIAGIGTVLIDWALVWSGSAR